MITKGSLRTCSKGHKYYKNSECPTCPICEQEKNRKRAFYLLFQHLQEER